MKQNVQAIVMIFQLLCVLLWLSSAQLERLLAHRLGVLLEARLLPCTPDDSISPVQGIARPGQTPSRQRSQAAAMECVIPVENDCAAMRTRGDDRPSRSIG